MTSYEQHANNNSRMTSLSKKIAPLKGKYSPNLIVIVISKLLKRYVIKTQAPLGTSLFTSAATNQRGFPKGESREAQVRFPEYQEGDRVAVKVGVVQVEKVNDQMGEGRRV